MLNSSYFLLKIYRIESYKKGIFFLLRILIFESVSFKIFPKKKLEFVIRLKSLSN
ncbi:hypothetical protein APS47_01680 [Leptospira kirschneri serovar Mozdok]|nr:hypothetical protein APS47_01680 [Leptospira kirschneri serovar Mozdok]